MPDVENLRNHPYLKMVEFGLDNKDGFKRNEAEEHVSEAIPSTISGPAAGLIFGEARTPTEGRNWFLRPEMFFAYLDFVELREAQRQARWAIWTASISILLTLASLAVNIWQAATAG